MARTPEGKVKDAITKILREAQVSYFFPATGGYGVSGIFDIVCCYNGRYIGIEAKSDSKKKPTALQSASACRAVTAGGIVLLIHKDNLDVLQKLLEDLKDDSSAIITGRSVWPTDSVIACERG